MAGLEIWTIGHWTCPEDVVLKTLRSARIDLLVDVRKVPGSRRSPQFNADRMPTWLKRDGIEYLHLPALCGRRPKQVGVDPSLNAGWRNRSFKNYADHTLTADYEQGLRDLIDHAAEKSVVVMCGEPMPWRCHRLLIANSLSARGHRVVHLISQADPMPHELGQWGASPRVDPAGVVTYPG